MITETSNLLPDTPLAIQFYYLLSYSCCYINVVGVSLQRIILWTLSYKYKNYLLLRILYSISSSVRSVREILWEELTTLKNLLILCGNKIILCLDNMIMILKYKWTIICGELVKITFKVVRCPYRYFLTLPENNNLNQCLFFKYYKTF